MTSRRQSPLITPPVDLEAGTLARAAATPSPERHTSVTRLEPARPSVGQRAPGAAQAANPGGNGGAGL